MFRFYIFHCKSDISAVDLKKKQYNLGANLEVYGLIVHCLYAMFRYSYDKTVLLRNRKRRTAHAPTFWIDFQSVHFRLDFRCPKKKSPPQKFLAKKIGKKNFFTPSPKKIWGQNILQKKFFFVPWQNKMPKKNLDKFLEKMKKKNLGPQKSELRVHPPFTPRTPQTQNSRNQNSGYPPPPVDRQTKNITFVILRLAGGNK